MNYRRLGNSGIEVSEIGFGAWAIGGSLWGGRRDEESRAAIARAVELGVNLFDTALAYGTGHSEELVGECVRAHNDKRIHVATKVPPMNGRWPAGRGVRVDDVFPPEHIRTSCEASLKNLGLERIDLLQLHVWEDAWTARDEWYQAMADLKAEGKIRLIGVSVNSHDPGSALRLVRSGRVDAIQVIYNIFDQSPEDALFPACLEHGVGVLARVPLDEGSLTGKLRLNSTFPDGDFRTNYFAGPMLAETVRRVEALRPIIENDAGAPSLARGALRFCLSHPAVSTIIPGIRTVAQADDNLGASADGPLPADIVAKLRPHRWVRHP